MTYKTVVDIKITSIHSEEQKLTMNEIVKSEVLSTQLKDYAKHRYLEALKELLQEESVHIDVQVNFVEDTQ